MTVFCFGSINIDHVYRVPHLVRPGETLAASSLDTVLGGKGANQSVALARAGATVRHVGRIGAADAALLETLVAAGVDIASVERPEVVSGHAIIQVDDAGENSIVLHGGANQGFDRAALETLLGDAREGDWLLMQNECDGLADAFAIAAERGLRIAFNPAPMAAPVAALPLERVELLILNETEARELAARTDDDGEPRDDAHADASGSDDAAMARLVRRWPGVTLVLTLGARGARLVSSDGDVRLAAPTVDAVDTTGAGDTFIGYLLAGLVAGLDAAAALERAVAAGALVVMREGATPAIPTAAQVDDFLRGADSHQASGD